MLVKIYDQNPSEKEISKVASVLEAGGVIIYPTDSVYAFGCSIRSPKAIERMRNIKGKKETTFSVVFDSLSSISEYCRIDNQAHKILRHYLPGAFTFIMPVLNKMPEKALEKRKTIGVRVPDNTIARAIVTALGAPMLTTSVRDDHEVMEYTTDPELIEERYGDMVDLIVDGGFGDAIPTTVVDLTGDQLEILRQGRGDILE